MGCPKVCMMAGFLPHDDARMIGREAHSLRERGCEVLVLCTDFEGTDSAGVCYRKIALPKGLWSQQRLASRFWKTALAWNANFYHFSDPMFLSGAAKHRRSGKMIYDLHQMPDEIFDSESLRRKQEQYIRQMYAVVAADPRTCDAVKRLNRRTVLIQNFPTMCELSAVHAKRVELRGNKFCCIGELSERHGLLHLLRAVRDADISLLLAGEFPSEEERLCAESDPGWSIAKYVGRPKTEGLRAILSVVRAGILIPCNSGGEEPPLYELLYLYMAAEVPVIVSNFPTWTEFVESANCGVIVDPENPEEIRLAIEYLRKNPDIAREMGQNGRQKILEQYNWDHEKEKLFGLYRLPME